MAITLNGGAGANAVTLNGTQTLTNKTLTSPAISNATFSGQQTGLEIAFNQSIVFEGTTADSSELTLTAGEPTADRTVTLPNATTTLVGTDTTDTLTNKTLTSPTLGGTTITASGNLAVQPATYILEVQGGASTEGAIQLNCAVNSHGQKIKSQPHAQAASNTLLLPGGTTIGNGDTTLVSEIGTQTLTNKTLTSPTIGTSASLSNQGEMRFVEATANGSNYVGFKAPSSIASNLIFTLPSADGTSTQVLQTDGSGVLSFATASSGVSANDQAFAFAVQVFA